MIFRKKLTSQMAAVFFAVATFCLASILIWEHLAKRSEQVSENQPISGRNVSGSDTITVIWGPDTDRVRLDEVTFENSGGGFFVRQKNNGKLVGYVDQANADKIRAYLRGN